MRYDSDLIKTIIRKLTDLERVYERSRVADYSTSQTTISGLAPKEGPGIDVEETTVGIGGDTILLYHANQDPVSEYAATDAGLTAAGAAVVSSQDIIVVPPMTFASNHTLAGCYYRLFIGVFTGQVTMSPNTVTWGGYFIRAGDTEKTIAVVAPSSGSAHMIDPTINVVTTTGIPSCVESGAGDIYIYCGRVSAENQGGSVDAFTTGTQTGTVDEIVWTFESGTEGWQLITGPGQCSGGDLYLGTSTDINQFPVWELDFVAVMGIHLIAQVGAYFGARHLTTTGAGAMNTTPYAKVTVVFADDDYASTSISGDVTASHNLKTVAWGTNIGKEIKTLRYSGYYEKAGETSYIDELYLSGYSGDVPATGHIYHYAVAGELINGIPLAGDLGVYDVADYPLLHTNDTDTATGIHHTLGTGANQAASGSHTHTGGLTPTIHDHSSDPEGGVFDAANLSSGLALNGDVLTADGVGGADWSEPDYFSSDPTIWEPDSPPDLVNSMDDDFSDSSTNTSLWSFFNPDVIGYSEIARGFVLFDYNGGDVSSGEVTGLYQAFPSGDDHTFTAKVSLDVHWDQDITAGILLGQDINNLATSDLVLYGIKRCTESNNNGIQAMLLDDNATWNNNYFEDCYDSAYGNFITTLYIRIRITATTMSFEYSSDGIGWTTRLTEALPWTPAFVGIAVRSGSGYIESDRAVFSWFRHRATSSWAYSNYGRRVHAIPEAAASISASPSESPSSSESPSLSASESISPSSSESVSASQSQSRSPSASLSPSQSVSPSQSASISPSGSASPSASESVSTSPSISESPSTSRSVSLSYSPSPSLSPSYSASPSSSVSPSISPSSSVSKSNSPSQSPSSSASSSVSPSLSPSFSNSPSESSSISQSSSESPSDSSSESPSESSSESPSVSPSEP